VGDVTIQDKLERRMTPLVRIALRRAQVEAEARGSPSVEPDDLLCALTLEPDSSVNRLVEDLGHSSSELRVQVGCGVNSSGRTFPGDTPFSEEGRSILHRAVDLADEFNHPRIGTEHLLLALVEARPSGIERLLESVNANEEVVRRALFGG
jgi:ATP-dependent Clp protease ATP-binding subunit ClpA